MTDLSTANLKRLLAEATPGPWTVEESNWGDIIVANEAGHKMTWGNGDQVRFKFEAGVYNEDLELAADPQLAALAPQLAQEVLRLRAGVERILEMCLLERDAAFQDAPMRAGEVTAFNLCSERLTDLLTGDQDG